VQLPQGTACHDRPADPEEVSSRVRVYRPQEARRGVLDQIIKATHSTRVTILLHRAPPLLLIGPADCG